MFRNGADLGAGCPHASGRPIMTSPGEAWSVSVAEVHDLAWIFGLFTLHLIVPGPSMLNICACASRGDRRQALAFVCGATLGTALWAAFAAFGAARLAAGAPLLLAGLKLSIGVALMVLGG